MHLLRGRTESISAEEMGNLGHINCNWNEEIQVGLSSQAEQRGKPLRHEQQPCRYNINGEKRWHTIPGFVQASRLNGLRSGEARENPHARAALGHFGKIPPVSRVVCIRVATAKVLIREGVSCPNGRSSCTSSVAAMHASIQGCIGLFHCVIETQVLLTTISSVHADFVANVPIHHPLK